MARMVRRWPRRLASMVRGLLDRGNGSPAEMGQGLAEYALILALIAIVAIVALIFLGNSISSILSDVGNSM